MTTILKYKGFEIYCKSGTIDSYRDSKLSIDKVLVTDNIYSDIKKGNLAKESDLEKIFGTIDINKCIEIMLQSGEYSMTTEERRKKVEQRKNEIISYISKNYIDPKSNTKLLVDTINEPLKKIKLVIDPHISGSKQAKDNIKKFTAVYPIKKISIDGTLNCPSYLTTKIKNILPKYSSIVSSKTVDNSLIMDLSVAPGDFDELMNILQKTTNGDFNFDLLDNSTSKNSNEDTKINKKKKKKKNNIDI